MDEQDDLFGAPPLVPEGLIYRRDLITADEEQALMDRIADLPFAPFQFHGFEGKRRTVSFGRHYRFEGAGALEEAAPMPDWLDPVRARAAALAGVGPDQLVHALVIEYAPGAGIGWHRDRPVFGDVVGVSLGSAAPLRFRRKVGERWQRFALTAEPRSAYLLTGPAREEWEHSILAVPDLRYSITFRTLR